MDLYIKYKFTLLLGLACMLCFIGFSSLEISLEPSNFKSPNTDCDALDSIPLFNFSSQQHSETGDFIFVYGHRREELSEKVKVNGKSNLELAIFNELMSKLGVELMSKPAYQNLEIHFLLTKKGEVEHMYLTNELFWYFEEPDMSKQVDNLNFSDEGEIEMARNLFDFMTIEEISEVKEIIQKQNWKGGKCNGKRVDTIISLHLAKNEILYSPEN